MHTANGGRRWSRPSGGWNAGTAPAAIDVGMHRLESTLGRPPSRISDRETGSSGEGVALAFHGRPATRFFGETTFGAATSTFAFPLSDGAQIYLVTAVMVDRAGHEYPTGIAPDEEILSETTISTTDPALRAAAHWLSAQAGCQR